MKKLIIACILFVLLATPTVLADSTTIEATIDESLYVTFTFTTDKPLYDEIKTEGFNASTIPNIIKEKFEQQGLTNARVFPILDQEIFNDTTYSIYVKFHIAGSDVIRYTLNETDMSRTFRVRTDWRKIKVSFTQDFSLPFDEYFGAPLTEWQRVNHTFEKSVEEDSTKMSFRFILPEKAFDIQAEEDTIIFKVPPVFVDTLVNSPFLILGAITIATIIFAAYRKAKR